MKDETKCEVKGQMSLAVRFSRWATFSVECENISIDLFSTPQPVLFYQMHFKYTPSKTARFQIRVRFRTLPNN